MEQVHVSGILTPGRGYIGKFDFTLNPYSGCTFGCAYCYAASFTRSPELRGEWGRWVKIKSNAAELVARSRKRVAGRYVYMSSVTDPYQPVELRTQLTRAILEALLPAQPALVVQTRSPFVLRDVDLLSEFRRCCVNITLSTDDDSTRRLFEPQCPSVQKRLETIRALVRAGLRVGVALAPLLPLSDSKEFCRVLRGTGASTFVVDPFHSASGLFRARTREETFVPARRVGWDSAAYLRTRELLMEGLPSLREGSAGFAPEVLLGSSGHSVEAPAQ